ncbi:hypothetical protein D3C81_2248970 [compost metagenome]
MARLAPAAAKLVATERQAYGTSRTLAKLYLPLTNRTGTGSFTERDAMSAADSFDAAALIA